VTWTVAARGFGSRGDPPPFPPASPADWPGFEMTYRFRSATYQIAVTKHADEKSGGLEVEMDGQRVDDARIHLVSDGAVHRVFVRIPKRVAPPPIEAPGPPAREGAFNGAGPAPARQ